MAPGKKLLSATKLTTDGRCDRVVPTFHFPTLVYLSGSCRALLLLDFAGTSRGKRQGEVKRKVQRARVPKKGEGGRKKRPKVRTSGEEKNGSSYLLLRQFRHGSELPSSWSLLLWVRKESFISLMFYLH